MKVILHRGGRSRYLRTYLYVLVVTYFLLTTTTVPSIGLVVHPWIRYLGCNVSGPCTSLVMPPDGF